LADPGDNLMAATSAHAGDWPAVPSDATAGMLELALQRIARLEDNLLRQSIRIAELEQQLATSEARRADMQEALRRALARAYPEAV